MPPITRREFVAKTALAAAAAQLVSSLRASEPAAPTPSAPTPPGTAPVRWLDGNAPPAQVGTTWGTAWPRGRHARDTTFALNTVAGDAVPVQSWPLATWPDGTLKWTAHAIPADILATESFHLAAGTPLAPTKTLSVTETADAIEIDTGVIRARLARRGDVLVPSLTRDGVEIATDGRLVCLREDRSDATAPRTEQFGGVINTVTVEQSGPVRAVVKFEGKHATTGREWLPFVVRLYFYAGGEAVRLMHTIIYDGEAQTDFVRGVGVRFAVPLRGALHDRHVRFSGQEEGLFAEAVRTLTGLRRDPGAAVKAAQIAGAATPPLETWNKQVSERLEFIPAFADYTLCQSSADGFVIQKRTKAGYTWLNSAQGQRAGGLGYVGTPQGGVAFGIRNFWQSHPAQLDIRGATGDVAEATAWVWSPEAPAMDLRPYHDGLGQDTYAKQYNGGLEITYEDYEPGFDSPQGVARTSELMLWAVAATPSRDRLAALGAVLRTPPVLVTTPEYLNGCGVFGGMWSPADRSSPAKAELEDKLAWNFDFYHGQQEQRRWYGFWNYGDVMHTYDADRHEWRYDVGGFAWDNSELSTDIWLWLYFLRTGRADVFRFAEAMTRHTGEVDVYHLGRFAPLGSRHNVLHWGCSAKQLRISTAVNRRYYYYLTGDERVGDLMREQLEAARALVRIPPGRKLFSATVQGDLARAAPQDPNLAGLGFGTDWGSIAGAWLTEWERTGSPLMRERLLNSMRSIAAQPRGFFSASAPMHLDTGTFDRSDSDKVAVSHLSAVFGLPEVCAELIQLLDVPEFKQAWLEYCELYSAPKEEQTERLGAPLRGNNLRQGHSRLTAYAAKLKGDPALAKRAWVELQTPEWGPRQGKPSAKHLVGPAVLRPVDEAPYVSTNDTAQTGLAIMQCLALAGEALPEKL
ncbi:MAG: Tat pathway signal sequence domain protein [Cephaloticoccus sp.]|nr:Tat pathway signal sequence domain protein [Cephaloticoccus sp.]